MTDTIDVDRVRALFDRFNRSMCQRHATVFVEAFERYAHENLGISTSNPFKQTASGDTFDSIAQDILGVPYSHVRTIKAWYWY